MPVRSLKGLRFAAIADVGGVFSDMNWSVVPFNCFHTSPPATPPPLSWPQPASPKRLAPANPAPVIVRNSRLVSPFEGLIAFLSPFFPIDAILLRAEFPVKLALPTAHSPCRSPSIALYPETNSPQKQLTSYRFSLVYYLTLMPCISPTPSARSAGQPPACPPKIIRKASCCRSSARSSMNNPKGPSAPAQMLPAKPPIPIRLRPSSRTSP